MCGMIASSFLVSTLLAFYQNSQLQRYSPAYLVVNGM